ncbi:MAG: Gfo/Idh/MocA family oxidoreductase [Acidobacteriota bacterium]
MGTRRQFIRGLSKNLAVVALLTPGRLPEPRISQQSPTKTRIGIIGAENSHTIEYGKIFNRDKSFPGCEVIGVWGETDEFAQRAAREGHIPKIVKDPAEFIGLIDALIVDHRHPKYHLAAARPFVAKGIPTFIDKPFCYRLAEGREFLELARSKKTPVSSFSTLSRGEAIADLKKQVKALTQLQYVISAGHCDVDSPYGGVFFYGVHQIERLMELFGEDISRVRVSRHRQDASAILLFASGLQATVILSGQRPPFEIAVVTGQGLRKLESAVKDDPLTPYREIVELFREGKESRSHESLLKEIAILEALERSVQTDRWEEVKI